MFVNPAMPGEEQSTCSHRGEAEGHVARCTCPQLRWRWFGWPGERDSLSWGCSWGWHSSRYWCCFLCTGVEIFVMLGYHALAVVVYWYSRRVSLFFTKEYCLCPRHWFPSTIFGEECIRLRRRCFIFNMDQLVRKWAGPQWFHQHPCGWGARFYRQESKSLVISESIRYTNHIIVNHWSMGRHRVQYRSWRCESFDAEPPWMMLIDCVVDAEFPCMAFPKTLSLLVPTLVCL